MKGFARVLICTGFLFFSACSQKTAVSDEPASVPYSLEELQKRTFHFFWDLADKQNYQVPDRYPRNNFSSIAATGFGLTAYCIGAEKGFISREEAAGRVLNTLKVLWNLPQGPEATGISGYKGLFYHFLNPGDAKRFKEVELSTIDTGLLMAGVLSAQSYFDQDNETEQEIRTVADALYRRVEWDWALNERGLLSMGWHPEKGYIKAEWSGYNEAMILLVLAIGSPTHPIPAESWAKWCESYQWAGFQGEEHVNFSPLFGHQYSQMYIDFKGIADPYMREKGIDYFENSRRATIANRAYCLENPGKFEGYGPDEWGLTACDGPKWEAREWKADTIRFMEYSARGASSLHIVDDGTIAPTAAGGSVAFAPEICLPVLEHLWNAYYNDLVGEYGFKDAFNRSYTFCEGCENGWFDDDYLGIDQGPILIQSENYLSGLVWETMKKNPYIRNGLKSAGFTGGWLEDNETK
ncbi:MAG TPA: glucoamylase family protein [Flavilitoribacter sp.]|nr:glucoamylase family protein [Flavilitoribacter sp.]HMQ86147.1 glucoamylase family protein [Flavilitoribacter sp.]